MGKLRHSVSNRPEVTQWVTSSTASERCWWPGRRAWGLGAEHRGEEYRVKLKQQVGTGKPAEAGQQGAEDSG